MVFETASSQGMTEPVDGQSEPRIPYQLREPDYRFILVGPRKKIPLEKDWQKSANYRYDSPRLVEHMARGGNYGLLGGAGGLIIVDIDDPHVAEEMTQVLPPTFTVRTGSGGMHFYLHCPSIDKKIILRKGEEHVGEVLSCGSFAVGPGSVHPSGDLYKILAAEDIANISFSELAVALAPYLPEKHPITDQKESPTPIEVVRDHKLPPGQSSKRRGGKAGLRQTRGNSGEKTTEEKAIESTSGKLPDGRFFEEILKDGAVCFAVYDPQTDTTTIEAALDGPEGKIVPRPVSGAERQAIILPDGVEEYGTTTQLLHDMEGLGRKVLDTGEVDIIYRVMVRLCLMSWAPEAQSGLGERYAPIVVARGPSETGKKRVLTVCRYLCRRTLYQLKSTKVPSLFRGLEVWDAVPVLDEADFRDSNESAEVIQFFNSRADGVPICRYNPDGKGMQWFNSFGLSVLAMRREAVDDGFNSRCFVYPAQGTRHPDDYDLLPPAEWVAEAMKVQRKLLLWRFRHMNKIVFPTKCTIPGVWSFRVREALLGVLALTREDPELAGEIQGLARDYQRRVVAERANSLDGMVLGAVYSAIHDHDGEPVPVGACWRIDIRDKKPGGEGEEQEIRVLNASWVHEQFGGAVSQADVVRVWRSIGQDVHRLLRVGKQRFRSVLKVRDPVRLDYEFQKYVPDAEPVRGGFQGQPPVRHIGAPADVQKSLSVFGDGQVVTPVTLVTPNHISGEPGDEGGEPRANPGGDMCLGVTSVTSVTAPRPNQPRQPTDPAPVTSSVTEKTYFEDLPGGPPVPLVPPRSMSDKVFLGDTTEPGHGPRRGADMSLAGTSGTDGTYPSPRASEPAAGAPSAERRDRDAGKTDTDYAGGTAQ